MSLISNVAGDAVKKKIGKWVAIKIGLPVICILLICAIPLLIIENIGNTFSSWFSGKESSYSSKSAAVKDWVKSLDNGFKIGEGYVSKDGILKYIDAEGSTYISNKTIKVTEYITTTTNSTKEGSTSTTKSYEQKKDYTIPLSAATSEYSVPWQFMSIVNASSMEPYSDNLRDSILDTFKTNFYGLFADEGETSISVTEINSNRKFRFTKKITTKVTTVETVTPENNLMISEDYYKQQYHGEVKQQPPPYTVTTTTVTTAEYPLPYFTRIETMKEDISLEYEDETTVNPPVTTISENKTITSQVTITQPVLKNKTEAQNAYGFFSKMKQVGLTTSDTSFLQEQLVLMPDGEKFQGYFDDVIPMELNGFDMYYGSDFGAGKLKLTGLGRFGWPVDAPVNVVSGFGNRIHPVYKVLKFHQGIDIDCNVGTDVWAADDGEVCFTGLNGGFGNLVIIKHTDNLYTYYGHLSKILTTVGKKVKKGDLIALSGGARGAPGSGTSTGPHLHFEVRKDKKQPLDPAPLLGLVPDAVDINLTELRYIPLKIDKVRAYLKKNNSKMGEPGYLEQVDSIARAFNINPALMIAITGQEMSFVKNDYTFWINVYGRASLMRKLKSINSSATIEEAPNYIINNPWNVYHSWWEYNKSFASSAEVCANTLRNLSKDCPKGTNPILWINIRGGRGGYAEDGNWWISVSRLFSTINNL